MLRDYHENGLKYKGACTSKMNSLWVAFIIFIVADLLAHKFILGEKVW